MYLVVIASIANLTVGTTHGSLWICLLSSCLGYMLPAPSFKSDLKRLRLITGPDHEG